MCKCNPFFIFISCTVYKQTWYFPSINQSRGFAHDLIIPPSVLFFLFHLAKPTEQLIVSDYKGILHVRSTKFSLVVIDTSQEQLSFHVQRRNVVNMNYFLLSVFEFIFLSVPTNIFDESLQHYVQYLLDLSARGFCVL